MAETPVKRRKKNVASREDVYKALRRAGFSKDRAIQMTAVAGTESAYDLGVVRPSTASGTGGNNMLGLFQISDIHKGTSWFKKYGDDWDDIDNQARMAKAVYDAQGLDKYSWASYGTPAYYQQLSKAKSAAGKVGDDIGKPAGKPERDDKKDSPKKPSGSGGAKKPAGKDKTGSKAKPKLPGGLNDNQMILIGAVAVVILLVVMK